MLKVQVDGVEGEVPHGSTVMDATNKIGVYVPHFCYHRKLAIAANCRMCLVEIEKAPKPLPACATPVTDGMKVWTHSPAAKKAQNGVMEFLLIKHPLDCPICDQGGECQLQDLAVGYGHSSSRYTEEKRVVPRKELGPLVAARAVESELSGNMIGICPVGALTSEPFRYSARTWELSRRKSVSPHDGLGAHLIVQVKSGKVMRVLPLENNDVNECWLSDKDRFAYEGLNSAERLTRPMLKQDGKWQEVEWQTALEYVAHGLRNIRHEHGADAIAALGTPYSTLEELSLLQKIVRGLGSENVDFRTRQSDFALDGKVTPWLGMSINEFAELDRAFVI